MIEDILRTKLKHQLKLKKLNFCNPFTAKIQNLPCPTLSYLQANLSFKINSNLLTEYTNRADHDKTI